MLPCTDKSKLLHNLQKLANIDETNEQTESPVVNQKDYEREPVASSTTSSTNKNIAVVDGMVFIQKLTEKKGLFSTVKDLAHSFNDRLMSLTSGFSEVILVFDTYKPDSLKEKTREKRRQGKPPVQSKMAEDTIIKHIPLTRFLSHEKNQSRPDRLPCQNNP